MFLLDCSTKDKVFVKDEIFISRGSGMAPEMVMLIRTTALVQTEISLQLLDGLGLLSYFVQTFKVPRGCITIPSLTMNCNNFSDHLIIFSPVSDQI